MSHPDSLQFWSFYQYLLTRKPLLINSRITPSPSTIPLSEELGNLHAGKVKSLRLVLLSNPNPLQSDSYFKTIVSVTEDKTVTMAICHHENFENHVFLTLNCFFLERTRWFKKNECNKIWKEWEKRMNWKREHWYSTLNTKILIYNVLESSLVTYNLNIIAS